MKLTGKNFEKTQEISTSLVAVPSSTIIPEEYLIKFAMVNPVFVNDIWQNLGEKLSLTDENNNPVKRPPLDLCVILDRRPEFRYEFFCKEALSANDLWVFQTIVGMAPISNCLHSGPIYIEKNPCTEVGKSHRETIKLRDEYADKDLWSICSTFPEFAREMGYAKASCRNPQIHALIKESLQRIYLVDIIVKTNEKDPKNVAGTKMLSLFQLHNDKTFTVSVNPLIVETLQGKHFWNKHNFEVIRQIKNPTTRLLHAHLMTRHREGEILPYSWDTLLRYGWPPFPGRPILSPILISDPIEKKAFLERLKRRKNILKTKCFPELERTGYWEFRTQSRRPVLIGLKNSPDAKSFFGK